MNELNFNERIVTLDRPIEYKNSEASLSRRDGTSRSVRSKSEVEIYEKKNAVNVKSKNDADDDDRVERKSNAIVYSIRKNNNADRDESPKRTPERKRRSRRARRSQSMHTDDSDYEYEQERLRRLRYPDVEPLLYPILKGLQTGSYYPPTVIHTNHQSVPTQIQVQPTPVVEHYQQQCCTKHQCTAKVAPQCSCVSTQCTTTPQGNFQRVSAEPQFTASSTFNTNHQVALPPPPILQSSYDYAKKPPPYYFDSFKNPPKFEKQSKGSSTEKIPSYLFLSIIACILCPICGIIALCFSNESRNHYQAREFNTAYTSGLRAKSFAYCGIFTNMVSIVLIAIITGITVGVLKGLNKI